MILQIAPVSQRDQRWASQRLGTANGITIGSHGCTITDMAMLATYYGHSITPAQLDDFLTNNNLYYDSDLFVNASITRLFPDIKFDKVVFCESTPAPIAEIKKYLDQGKPCVAALINQGVRHYILITGYEGDRMFCNDPWQGDQVAINDRWGDPATKILQINFFSGPVPVVNIPIPTPPAPTHPLDGPHMDDTPPQPQPPITFENPQPISPSDPAPVNPAPNISQGLSDLQNTLAEVIISANTNPVIVKTTNQIFIDSLKSRKFILSVLASLTALVNSTLHIGLSQDQLMIFILPILAFVIVEGAADIAQRLKGPAPK